MKPNPKTLDACRAEGETHYAYVWARTPRGDYSEEQRAAYFEGFDAAKAADPTPRRCVCGKPQCFPTPAREEYR